MTPEATAEAWVGAYAVADAGTLASLHVPEQRDVQGSGYADWTRQLGGADFSASNLSVQTLFQTEDKAEVIAEYDWEFMGSHFHREVKFGLEKRNGEWLISALRGGLPESVRQTIEVFVHDTEATPIAGAEVVLFGEITFLTNDEGMAAFEYVRCPKSEDLVVSKAGYEQGAMETRPGEPWGDVTLAPLRPPVWVTGVFLYVEPGGFSNVTDRTITLELGEVITIEAIVEKTVEISDPYEVVVEVNGEFYVSQTVDVTDQSARQQFTLSFHDQGMYEIAVDGKSFTAVVE